MAIPKREHDVADYKQSLSMPTIGAHDTGMCSGYTTLDKCKRRRQVFDEDAEVSPFLTVRSQQIIVTLVSMDAFGGACHMLTQLLFQGLQQKLRAVGDPRSNSIVDREKIVPFRLGDVLNQKNIECTQPLELTSRFSSFLTVTRAGAHSWAKLKFPYMAV
jgi:hypothetical protein